ncbi:MAG: hypothetical protein JXP34_06470 [Planctomycetes bacterium]|nr:hypothetical protein [Planctomycetota bacterium]
MSGIAGIVGERASRTDLESMLRKIRHRGPDDLFSDIGERHAVGVATASLGRQKGAGHAVQDGCLLLFDGEIYNDRPPGASDADVALHLYRRHGRTFGARLHGAFAACVRDGERLILARDAVGIRPMYWGYDAGGAIRFASEIKALVGAVREIRALPPGTVWSAEGGLQRPLPVHPDVAVPDRADEAARVLRDLLFQATQRRLADGAVGGILLSGGLDSSVIAAIAHQLDPALPAFTVGAKGAPDIRHAMLVARHIGIRHRIKQFDASEVKALIPTAIYALESFDEDCVSGAISNLMAARFAAMETNCILSGEGSDELLGGYLMLKDLPDDASRLDRMERLIAVAHNTALQRLDRAMMFHSINYRTPFLDAHVAAFCLQLPVRWKLHPAGPGRIVEKWILREAFRDLLPEEILRREKLRFSAGTGTDATIEGIGNAVPFGDRIIDGGAVTGGGFRMCSPREREYYLLFKGHFPDESLECLVGRWDPEKV